MFAFALFDRKTKKIFLCRDRLGIKPLYWTIIKNELIFSSELKAFHYKMSFKNEINENIIPNFLRHGYIPSLIQFIKMLINLSLGNC